VNDLLIGVVGPCKAGKSTLVENLLGHGYIAKVIAQEHSYVPSMWKRITNPDTLVYLDVSYPVTLKRSTLNWTQTDFDQQIIRLKHALQHAHIYIHTDNLTPEEVLSRVLYALNI
jgi:hypothetical protein